MPRLAVDRIPLAGRQAQDSAPRQARAEAARREEHSDADAAAAADLARRVNASEAR